MISMVMWEHTSKSYGEIHEGIVDNKNRVLLLRTETRFTEKHGNSVVSIRKIGGSNPPLGTIQTKYECIWIILMNKI